MARQTKVIKYYREIRPYPNAHPLVRALFFFARKEMASVSDLAKAANVSRNAVGEWGSRFEPKLSNLIAAGNSLGWDLKWVRMKDND